MDHSRAASEGQVPTLDPDAVIQSTLQDQTFQEFLKLFLQKDVKTWSTEREKALLYGLAASLASNGVIVELGSYCGGSASFFAKGLDSRAGSGRVVCVDPLLGAPPWLCLPAGMFTLDVLRRNLGSLGLEHRIDVKVGDSYSVGAAWPAEPIDILLIDGDHSFEGAMRDLECWAPKIRDGGILLFDDIDNIHEMRVLDEIMKQMSTLARIGTVDGIGVYQVRGGRWALLDELRGLLGLRGIHRPWSFDAVHSTPVASPYRHTKFWTDPTFDIGYDLGYLAVADKGDYGIFGTPAVQLRQLIMSIQTDRGGGDLHVGANPGRYGTGFRLIGCDPHEAPQMVRLLQPGGLVLCASETPMATEEAERLCEVMRKAGLDGVGQGGGAKPLFWGVAGISSLPATKLVESLMAVRHPASAVS